MTTLTNEEMKALVERLDNPGWDGCGGCDQAKELIEQLIARAEAAAAALAARAPDAGKLREALREIDAAIYNDNGDVTWSPMEIRRIARSALSASRKEETSHGEG